MFSDGGCCVKNKRLHCSERGKVLQPSRSCLSLQEEEMFSRLLLARVSHSTKDSRSPSASLLKSLTKSDPELFFPNYSVMEKNRLGSLIRPGTRPRATGSDHVIFTWKLGSASQG